MESTLRYALMLNLNCNLSVSDFTNRTRVVMPTTIRSPLVAGR